MTEQTLLAQANLREQLIATLIRTKQADENVQNYYNVLRNDFMAFANSEGSLQEEAQALLMLEDVGKELSVIAGYPDFYRKHIIAIAGGFSAGKSSFINSLIKDKAIALPTNINPTTAIPTYVLNGANQCRALNNHNALIDLDAIDENFHAQFSHQFISQFGFNLKEIMPKIFLNTPMAYEHICFIDTPGYDPAVSSTHFTSEDEQTAKDFVSQADAIIWVIGLDANGTIPKADLDFLSDIDLDKKPLYVVLNKADTRPLSAVEEVMETVEDVLEEYEIPYSGIGAYSSLQGVELTSTRSLHNFLAEFNQPCQHASNIVETLFKVDEMYQKAILTNIRSHKNTVKQLENFGLSLLAQGIRTGEKSQQMITEMQAPHNAQIKTLQKQLTQLTKVMQAFAKPIGEILQQDIMGQRKILTQWDLPLKGGSKSELIKNKPKTTAKTEKETMTNKTLQNHLKQITNMFMDVTDKPNYVKENVTQFNNEVSIHPDIKDERIIARLSHIGCKGDHSINSITQHYSFALESEASILSKATLLNVSIPANVLGIQKDSIGEIMLYDRKFSPDGTITDQFMPIKSMPDNATFGDYTKEKITALVTKTLKNYNNSVQPLGIQYERSTKTLKILLPSQTFGLKKPLVVEIPANLNKVNLNRSISTTVSVRVERDIMLRHNLSVIYLLTKVCQVSDIHHIIDYINDNCDSWFNKNDCVIEMNSRFLKQNDENFFCIVNKSTNKKEPTKQVIELYDYYGRNVTNTNTVFFKYVGVKANMIMYKFNFNQKGKMILDGKEILYFGIDIKYRGLYAYDRSGNPHEIIVDKNHIFKKQYTSILKDNFHSYSATPTETQHPECSIKRDSNNRIIQLSVNYPWCPTFSKVYDFHYENDELPTIPYEAFRIIDDIFISDHKLYVTLMDEIIEQYN